MGRAEGPIPERVQLDKLMKWFDTVAGPDLPSAHGALLPEN